MGTSARHFHFINNNEQINGKTDYVKDKIERIFIHNTRHFFFYIRSSNKVFF